MMDIRWNWPVPPSCEECAPPPEKRIVSRIVFHQTIGAPGLPDTPHLFTTDDAAYPLQWVKQPAYYDQPWEGPSWEELVVDQIFDEKVKVYRPILKWFWPRILFTLGVICALAACIYLEVWALWH